MDLTDLVVEANRLSGLLDKGIAALRDASVRHAQADHHYRKSRAIAYLQASGTVAERDAHADIETAEGRLDRDLAAGEAEGLEKRLERGVPSSPRSSRFSTRTGQRPSLRPNAM